MSHSAHRFATPEELKRDFVIFVRPAHGFDDVDEKTKEATLKKTRELADIVHRHGPANIGRSGAGSTGQGDDYEKIMKRVTFNGFMSVVTDREKAKSILRAFKEKDAGLSVVASGLTDELFGICREVGLKPHTVLFSLGIWGKQALLPSDDHLKITTLCGHSMISPAMIDHYVDRIRAGRVTPEEAGRRMACSCPCGIFNVPRTVEVLKAMAAKPAPAGGEER